MFRQLLIAIWLEASICDAGPDFIDYNMQKIDDQDGDPEAFARLLRMQPSDNRGGIDGIRAAYAYTGGYEGQLIN